jgi:hypothetical protein
MIKSILPVCAALAILVTAGNAHAGVTYYSTADAFASVAGSIPTETFAAITLNSDLYAQFTDTLGSGDAPGLLAGATYATTNSPGENTILIAGVGFNFFGSIGNSSVALLGAVPNSTVQILLSSITDSVGLNVYTILGTGSVTASIYGAFHVPLGETTVLGSGTGPTFLGISSDQAITEVDLSPSPFDPVLQDPYIVGFSDLSFGQSSVPEPASMVLFGAGLLGLGAVHRRRA